MTSKVVRTAMACGFTLAAVATMANCQSLPNAASITETTRTIAHALDTVFAARANEEQGSQRAVLLVVDPTTSVAQSGFAKELSAAIERAGAEFKDVRLGLFVPSEKPRKVGLTTDHRQVVTELSEALATPEDRSRNFFAILRDTAPMLGKASGPRRLLLVTFDNGDFEDDVEATGQLLVQRKIETHVLTLEAFLADCYWAGSNRYGGWSIPRIVEWPEKSEAVGGDSPLIDVPFGFLLQTVASNTITVSGYAPYAFSRLAQVGGGRVHLFSGDVTYDHCCILYGECPVCGVHFYWPDPPGNRHEDHGEDYRQGRLEQVAPLLGSRVEAARQLAQDPAARATFAAWRSAYDAGIVSGKPSLRVKGQQVLGDIEKNDAESKAYDRLRDELLDVRPIKDPQRAARQARAAADEALRIETELRTALDAVTEYHPREMGIGRYTQAMLLLTRLSLLSLERFYADELPAHHDKLGKSDRRDAYIFVRPRSICHGMAHYARTEESDLIYEELVRLDEQLAAFEKSFAGSPIYFAMRRMSYPRFTLEVRQAPRKDDGKRPQPEDPQDPTTPPRPPRPGSRPASPQTPGGR
jgi:hypothetical protein